MRCAAGVAFFHAHLLMGPDLNNVPSTLFPDEAAMTDIRAKAPPSLETDADSSAVLLRGLVAHLRQHRTELRKEWARRIIAARLLHTMTDEEIFAEVTSVYDNYLDTLETGTFEALQAYARKLSERIIPRGVQTDRKSTRLNSSHRCISYAVF